MVYQPSLFTPAVPKPRSKPQRRKGNTQLMQHGIFEDESKWRIHLSCRLAYVFPTQAMKRLVGGNHRFREVPAYQKGFNGPTAKGFLVPINAAPHLQRIEIPADLITAHKWPHQHINNLGMLGQISELISKEMLQRGLIPCVFRTDLEDSLPEQFVGTDIKIKGDGVVVQVKTDTIADSTGNLYIQTHECNPFKIH